MQTNRSTETKRGLSATTHTAHMHVLKHDIVVISTRASDNANTFLFSVLFHSYCGNLLHVPEFNSRLFIRYVATVGHGGVLNMNIAPAADGLMNASVVAVMHEAGKAINDTFHLNDAGKATDVSAPCGPVSI